jgi:hypothetical protein
MAWNAATMPAGWALCFAPNEARNAGQARDAPEKGTNVLKHGWLGHLPIELARDFGSFVASASWLLHC